MKKRILIADDHPIVRAGLKKIIDDAEDMVVADEAGNCTEAIKKIREHAYDVVVLDITMPNGSGLEILKQIKEYRADLPVLILSIHPEGKYAIRTLSAGASGYLNKQSADDELLKAIRAVYVGKKYLSPALTDHFVSGLSADIKKMPHELLTDREYQIIAMIADGISIKQIAKDLNLSTKTVSTHRARALNKMNMTTNAELVRYFVENSLLI
jgi:two-component system, NarL family, invasion response regulator UvrY